jgi:hypothetical protein
MPNAEAGETLATIYPIGYERVRDAVEQQLRDAKQKAAPLPKRSERSDHEDILEGLEREYASAMAKLQAAHEREMLLSSRVGELQKKLQACACVRGSSRAIFDFVQDAAEENSTLKQRETELALSLQQTQVVHPLPPQAAPFADLQCRRKSRRGTSSFTLIWSNCALKQNARSDLLWASCRERTSFSGRRYSSRRCGTKSGTSSTRRFRA